MIRKDMRRLDEYRFAHAGPLENDLVDELAEGGMDRQEFIKRATVLGLSVGVIGAALAAYDAPLAFGAPAAAKAGGRLRLGIVPPPAKEIEPHTFQDQGAARDRRRRRRVPDPGHAEPDAQARARAQLEAERDGERVDVQAATERQVPERPGIR